MVINFLRRCLSNHIDSLPASKNRCIRNGLCKLLLHDRLFLRDSQDAQQSAKDANGGGGPGYAKAEFRCNGAHGEGSQGNSGIESQEPRADRHSALIQGDAINRQRHGCRLSASKS
jgi:hypothetical protein